MEKFQINNNQDNHEINRIYSFILLFNIYDAITMSKHMIQNPSNRF